MTRRSLREPTLESRVQGARPDFFARPQPLQATEIRRAVVRPLADRADFEGTFDALLDRDGVVSVDDAAEDGVGAIGEKDSLALAEQGVDVCPRHPRLDEAG